QGERPVETLSAGDLVLNKDGVPVRLLWKARRHIPGADLRSSPALRPVCIPRGAMGRQMPHSDLYLSPQHRVLVSHGRNALHFGYEAVLIPAKFLIGSLAHESCPAEGITYYHLLFEQHEIILSNGLETESYQPSLRALGGMEEDARLDFMAEIPRDWRRKLMFREDAYYSVKSYEAPLVALPQPA
ncbi:Hint domain-containing protein, partial [Actibacterium sp.]|uniref:Hint domain-containing protein n=1 Tax=Actibacterium sp. TaxID=1872125 RepID=UPI003568960D